MTLKIRDSKEKTEEIYLEDSDVGVFVKINGKFKALFCPDGVVHLYDMGGSSNHQARWKEE